jgi:hypothetical protein
MFYYCYEEYTGSILITIGFGCRAGSKEDLESNRRKTDSEYGIRDVVGHTLAY